MIDQMLTIRGDDEPSLRVTLNGQPLHYIRRIEFNAAAENGGRFIEVTFAVLARVDIEAPALVTVTETTL